MVLPGSNGKTLLLPVLVGMAGWRWDLDGEGGAGWPMRGPVIAPARRQDVGPSQLPVGGVNLARVSTKKAGSSAQLDGSEQQGPASFEVPVTSGGWTLSRGGIEQSLEGEGMVHRGPHAPSTFEAAARRRQSARQVGNLACFPQACNARGLPWPGRVCVPSPE